MSGFVETGRRLERQTGFVAVAAMALVCLWLAAAAVEDLRSGRLRSEPRAVRACLVGDVRW